MKNRIRKKVKRGIGLIMAVLFLVCVPGNSVLAAAADAGVMEETDDEAPDITLVRFDVPNDFLTDQPMARTFLTNCSIIYSCSERGLVVDFITSASQVASVIGVKDIELEIKHWYGWSCFYRSPGCENEDSDSIGCTLTYKNAKVGATYRISCVHYADVDGYVEVENETDGFEFKYDES